ncbi:hypothetical protein JMJ77_0013344 [Colletotrichum scovillei]|uniref:Uncharacterized protein n=1 Tax=Colletotrichum scovillei TaxID=1209932 RepID=A0A9P7UD03_9PEZI|nr:hypothetical protein JMJ77_0013344 [Colletotrichum scovillei]KAG7069645.1 hypothetical protein JMJ76_0003308 [Colletotrichum scovillei]KAG7073575.1 hypothetical protein JMJ78_0014546 [Colletotrichum scovillei]
MSYSEAERWKTEKIKALRGGDLSSQELRAFLNIQTNIEYWKQPPNRHPQERGREGDRENTYLLPSLPALVPSSPRQRLTGLGGICRSIRMVRRCT